MSSWMCLPNTVKWLLVAVEGFRGKYLSRRWRRWATEVPTDSSLSYWSVLYGKRAGRGLTTQKGSRPSTSLFYGHILRLAASVTETASETALFDGGMYLLKPLFFLFGSSMLYLTCSDACKCCAYITYEAVAEMVENLCICSSTPSLPQIRQRYVLFPWIEQSAHHSARLFWVIQPRLWHWAGV